MRFSNEALLTDLYQLTMVYGYWKERIAEHEAVFHLYFRKKPFKGGFALAAGLADVVSYIESLKFSSSDLEYLSHFFERPFLDFLSKFTFQCDVDAVPEGSLVFPQEPLIRVRGPLWQAQMLESPLLNRVNFETLIATKAARICLAAHPDPVVEFGMRRAQGPDGAISASRAAFIGGCESTSHVLAGKLFDIPVVGTQAHSWIMAFDEEVEAFRAFARSFPKGGILLVDTYDSLRGVQHAMDVARALKWPLKGIRLDSGDLGTLSIACRKLLDEQGFHETKIMASNELDEYAIHALKKQNTPICIWGVGTHLVTAKDQPALDGIYKLAAIRKPGQPWKPKVKLSDQQDKATNPGILQVRRALNGQTYTGDVLYDEELGTKAKGKDLLIPLFRKGKFVGERPSLREIQAHAKNELSRLPESIKQLDRPQPYPVTLDPLLVKQKQTLLKKL
jgi:nicotinate phosphoribosyltransferase